MPGQFTRLKTWILNEDVKSTDLNGEFDNVLNNADAAHLGGYSANASQMRSTKDPGSSGSENLPLSIADELMELRFAINRILGGTYWYDTPSVSLSAIGTSFNSGTTPINRISSGRVDANNQSMALQASGTTATVKLLASSTPMNYYIDGNYKNLTSDVTSATLSTAPTTGNTATLGFTSVGNTTSGSNVVANTGSMDGIAIGQPISGSGIPGGTTVSAINTNPAFNSLTLSANATATATGVTLTFSPTATASDTEIPIISAGSAIAALVGQVAVFKQGTEYFLAYVRSSTKLSLCMRGIFFNSSDSNLAGASMAAGATITLMKAVWIFVNASGGISLTYNPPKYAKTSPVSPSIGDYWFNFTDFKWYTYSGTWNAASATLVGMAVCDSSHCVASRTFEYYKPFARTNSLSLELLDTANIQSSNDGGVVSVMGSVFTSKIGSRFTWNSPNNLDGGGSISSSTTYYAYVKDTGDVVLSTVPPLDRQYDMLGFYHPSKPWRAVGGFTTDSSGNIQTPFSYGEFTSTVNAAKSQSCGSFTVTSATYADVANLQATLATRGRPVKVNLSASGALANSQILVQSGSQTNIRVLRDGTEIASWRIDGAIKLPTSLEFVDTDMVPGTHVYKIQAGSVGGLDTITNATLKLVEL